MAVSSCSRRACLDLIDGDDGSWEGSPLIRLAARGELMAFEHRGFWHPMDTLRDKTFFEEFWAWGKAPWKIWYWLAPARTRFWRGKRSSSPGIRASRAHG